MAYQLDGYVDVAERIRQLREKHPEAVLRPWNPDEPFKIMNIGNREFIVYTAACYRTPDDPMPAVAVAAEPAVGKTNYTRDSEVMNAETSAWGRCIVACLAADTQKVASLNEVQNRRAEQQQSPASVEDSYDPTGPIPFPKKTAAAPRPQPTRTESSGSSGEGISEKQRGFMMKLAREQKLDSDMLRALMSDIAGRDIEDTTTLSKIEATKVIKALVEGA